MEKEPEKPKCEHYCTDFSGICGGCGKHLYDPPKPKEPTCPKGGTCMAMVTEWINTQSFAVASKYKCQKCLRPMDVNQ